MDARSGGAHSNDDAEPFAWTKAQVRQRRVKGRRRLGEL